MLNVNKATDQVDSRAKPCYGKPVSVQKLVVSGRHGGRLPMPPLMRRTWLSIFFVCASKIQTPARAARGRQNVFAFLLSSFCPIAQRPLKWSLHNMAWRGYQPDQ